MTHPTRRVDRGRGHSYFLDNVPRLGVTKVLDDGVPKPALVGWAANVTIDRVTDDWDALVEMKPSERAAFLRRARFEAKDEAARRGSEVHSYALRLQAGEEVDVPEELEGHVDAYLQFVAEWEPRELVVETVVGNRRWRYMGTLDAVAQLADGQVWLLDWKTGGKGVYPETALQLAAYRYAEFLLLEDGTELPMPQVDACGAVWLRADGYDLVPVQADEDAFRTFRFAIEVAKFTQAPIEAHIGAAVQPPERSVAV